MFALVDCNSFYVSCERVFRPDLKKSPVVVLSNNDGCIISRSDEAKAIGIPMGAPLFKIKDLIKEHNVAVFSSNYALYGDLSDRVMKTLASVVPDIEIYSIDEAFLDLNDYEDNLEELGHSLRNKVKQYTGIPVGIGIAPTKTLAKLANRIAKKNNGISVIYPDTITEVLKNFPIEDVWGIGRRISVHLKNRNIDTAEEFTQQTEEWIRKQFGITGLRIYRELKGIPCIELEETGLDKKSICTTRSFGKLQTDYASVLEALSNHAASCAEKLRRQHCCAGSMYVFIQTNRFRKQDEQYRPAFFIKLPEASNNTGTIIQYAEQALKQIFKTGYKYNKCGITVMDIVPENVVQLNCFESKPRDKWHALEETIDKLNLKMGKKTLRHAIEGFKNDWKLRNENMSPNYTTKWNEILEIDLRLNANHKFQITKNKSQNSKEIPISHKFYPS